MSLTHPHPPEAASHEAAQHTAPAKFCPNVNVVQEISRVRLNDEQVIGEIRGIFADRLAIEVESPSVDLLDTGLVDSVTLVELLLVLEQQFGVSLPLEDLEMEDFRSVARIADLVARTRSASSNVPSLASPLVDPAPSASGAAA
jgi:acyl carrier protein